jgi:hypothetical protein
MPSSMPEAPEELGSRERSFSGPGWATLRPPPGTPFGTTAPHYDAPSQPISRVGRLLADGVGYALASLICGVLALIGSRSARGVAIAVEAALVAAAIQFGRAAWRASINTMLATAGGVLGSLAVIVLIAHNPGAIVGYW